MNYRNNQMDAFLYTMIQVLVVFYIAKIIKTKMFVNQNTSIIFFYDCMISFKQILKVKINK